MKNRLRYIALVSSLSVLFLFILVASCASVPVIPNESIVEGIVSEYAVLSARLAGGPAEQVFYRLTITVESSEKKGRGPDFLRNRTGRDVQFYSKDRLSPDLFGRKVRARVRYRGDERGGRFWILEIETLE